MQKLEQRYAAAPDDAAVLEEYCNYLESYLKDGFVQGRAAEIQRHQLEQLLKKRLENLGGRRSCTLECRLADVQLSLAEYDRAEKTLEELTARWPQREAPWVLCLRLAAARRDGEAIRKTLGQIEEKEVYLSAKGRRDRAVLAGETAMIKEILSQLRAFRWQKLLIIWPCSWRWPLSCLRSAAAFNTKQRNSSSIISPGQRSSCTDRHVRPARHLPAALRFRSG